MRSIDAAFLAMERPTEPRHLGVLMIFDPSADGPLDRGSVASALEARLPTMRTARRVVVPPASGLTRPSWRTVDHVDLDAHLHATTLPRDGEPTRELELLVARRHAEPLRRDRPLWEMLVVDGLPHDRVAIYAKVHMAAVDDRTGVELMTGLLDEEPDGEPTIDDVEVHTESANRFVDRLVGPVPEQVRRGVGFPVRLAARAARTVGDQLPGLGATASEFVRRTPGAEAVARLLPAGHADGDGEHPTGRAPRLSFNEPIGPDRIVALGSVPIERIVDIRAAVRRESDSDSFPDVSFHAVVLAGCAGGLRRWLIDRRELPTSPTVAVIPVLARAEHDADAHVAGLTVALATQLDDPVDRLVVTARELAKAKDRYGQMPVSLSQDIAMFAPAAVASLTTRVLDALPHRRFVSPTVNLGISNVPGPSHQVFLAGRPLRTSHPILSVTDITPLHLATQVGPHGLGLGATADAASIDDLRGLLDAVDTELVELADALGVG